MKILIKIVVAFLLLLVVGLVALYFSINGIAKYAIDNAGTSALGVTTHVDAVSIGIFSGDILSNQVHQHRMAIGTTGNNLESP